MVVLAFLIDGLGYYYLKKEMPGLPCISQLCEDGKFTKIDTLLGYSSAILPAIWSGTSPEKNGVWCEYFLDPRKPHLLSHLFKAIPSNGLRRLCTSACAKVTRKFHIQSDYSYSVFPEVEHMFSRWRLTPNRFPIIQIPGIPMITDFLNENRVSYSYYYYERPLTQRDLTEFVASLPRQLGSNELIVIYSTIVDHMTHVHGLFSDAVKFALGNLDMFVKNIIQKLEQKTSNLELVVFSDHGMASISQRVNIHEILSRQGIQQPRDLVAFYDSTLARFWFLNGNTRSIVERTLENADFGRILSEDDLKRYHLSFSDNKYGELIFLLNEGVEIYPSYMHTLRKEYVKAMHGYDPELPLSAGFLLYSGQKFNNIKKRVSVLDICSSILDLIGIGQEIDFEGSSFFV